MTTEFLFANFAHGTLQEAVTTSGTTLTVTATQSMKFPALATGQAFRAVLQDGTNAPEIVECTANPQNGTLTVVRAKESTAAVAWPAGTKIINTLTADTIKQIVLDNVAITGGTITGITDLAVADGGTGASTASAARTNLSAQEADANLTGLSGITAVVNGLPYFTATDGTMGQATLSTFARTLVDDATAGAARTTLGLGAVATASSIGTTQITNGAVTATKLATQYLPEVANITTATSGFTLTATHGGKSVYCNFTATGDVTIPASTATNALPVGFQCELVQYATGGKVKVVTAATGDAIRAMDSFVKTTDRGKRMYLQVYATGEYFLEGGQEVA